MDDVLWTLKWRCVRKKGLTLSSFTNLYTFYFPFKPLKTTTKILKIFSKKLPSKHTTSFWRWYNVVWASTTLLQRPNNVVCLMGERSPESEFRNRVYFLPSSSQSRNITSFKHLLDVERTPSSVTMRSIRRWYDVETTF